MTSVLDLNAFVAPTATASGAKKAPSRLRNGSKLAPGGDGNTKSPPSAKDRGSCMKTWILTLKADDGSNGSIRQWIATHCDSAVWQIERGHETGYVHFQLTLTLKVKQRLTWLKNHFAKSCHAEVVRNVDAAFDYTQKTDSRIAGPFYFPAPVQPVRDPLAGRTPYPWQKEVLDIVAQEPDERTVHWYWEPTGGVGKTALCKHLILQHDAQMLNGKKADMAHALRDDVKIVCIDLARVTQSYAPYEAIEQIKNGLIFSGKYDSRTKVFNSPHVIVFANYPPDMAALSADRWHVVCVAGAAA